MLSPTRIDTPVAEAITVEEIGIDAAPLLADGGARVGAVFARSLYLRRGDRWMCIGPRELGSGPINVLCALPLDLDWRRRGPSVGTEVNLTIRQIRLAPDLVLNAADAIRWRPDPPAPWTNQTLAGGLAAFDGLAPARIPLIGLGGFARPRFPAANAESRHAAPAIRDLTLWLRGSAETAATDDRMPGSAAERLLCLGPGLTPSGDDFLGGALIALRLLGRDSRAERLWAAIEPLLRRRTVAVSAAHLAAAARGHGNAALHHALDTILSGRTEALPAALARVDAIGHCSGWDALAGAIISLRE